MGQKTHPIGFRLGTQYAWKSKWFSQKNYQSFLEEDIKIRQFLQKKLKRVGLERVEIERSPKKVKISLLVSKPGLIIGRSGSGIESLKEKVENIVKKRAKDKKVQIAVLEVKEASLSAKLVAEEIASQIERRIPVKRIMNHFKGKVMDAGAKGVKIACKGRIGGQEIARMVWTADGAVPLQTLKTEIDFARATALTKYGTLGVKVWINKGEKPLGSKKEERKKE